MSGAATVSILAYNCRILADVVICTRENFAFHQPEVRRQPVVNGCIGPAAKPAPRRIPPRLSLTAPIGRETYRLHGHVETNALSPHFLRGSRVSRRAEFIIAIRATLRRNAFSR